MNIIEGNKLIAKFMGYKYYPYDFNFKIKDSYNFFGWIKNKEHLLPMSIRLGKFGLNYLCRSHKDLNFHEDWNWLMGVIGHIKKYLLNDGNVELYQNINQSLLSLDIEKVWKSVVIFIEDYNKNEKEKIN